MNEGQIRKRNFITLTIEGACFFTGLAFIDVNAVIPVFIYTYTQSLKLAGLATTINLASSIVAQTLLGPYVKSIRNVPSYITLMMLLFRPLPFLMIPVLFSQLSPLAIALAFLVIYALIFVGDGLVVVPWTDLFGRTVTPENRGKLLGYQQLLGGIGGLAAGFIVKYVLEYDGITDTVRYSIIFGCAAVTLSLSVIVMMLTRDLPHAVAAKPARNWHYYAQLPAYLRRNREFRRVAVIRILAGITGMIAPFLILFGKERLSLSNSQVSTLVYVQIAGTLVGGILWGMISSRFGNKYVILATQIIGLLIPAAGLACFWLGPQHFPWFGLWPVILANGANMGSWLGYISYIIDISGEEERTVYLLLSSLITLPLTILAFLAGIIAEIVGFAPLFCICVLTALSGILAARRLKSPRQLAEEEDFSG